MRSSLFVLFSVLVHAVAVAAIAISPSRVSAPEGNHPIEVSMGEPADQPGVEEAPVAPPAAAVPVTEPTPEPVQVAKAATRKTRTVQAPMQKVRETALPKKEVPAEDTQLDPEISEAGVSTLKPTPAPETPPAGVEADESDDSTEAGNDKANAVDPSPKGEDIQEGVDLVHGGATKAGAVSYLDLKQAPGNKSPTYPMGARRENRQGQVELVYRVTKEGRVSDLQIAKSSGHKDLDTEAARAVAMFKFVPGQEGWARHPVSFSLKGESAQAPSKLRSAQAE